MLHLSVLNAGDAILHALSVEGRALHIPNILAFFPKVTSPKARMYSFSIM
jgi:hypothetical protein